MDFNLIFMVFGLVVVLTLLWMAIDQIPPTSPIHNFIWILRILLLLLAAAAVWGIFGLGRRFADAPLSLLGVG